MEKDHCTIITIGPLSGPYANLQRLSELCRSSEEKSWTGLETAGEPHTVFDLPVTVDRFLESISKRESKNIRYEFRRLQKEHTVTCELIPSNSAITEFDRFASMHTSQWNSDRRPGHFGAWPKAFAFNKALVERLSTAGRLRLIRLSVDGNAISYQYGFVYGTCYFWQLPARVLGTQWEWISLGRVGIITMIEQLCKEGVLTIEAGLGHYDYKLKLGAREHLSKKFLFSPGNKKSFHIVNLFRLQTKYLSFIHNKLLYRKIQPRLPKYLWHCQWPEPL